MHQFTYLPAHLSLQLSTPFNSFALLYKNHELRTIINNLFGLSFLYDFRVGHFQSVTFGKIRNLFEKKFKE